MTAGFPKTNGRLGLSHRRRNGADLCQLEGTHHVKYEVTEVSTYLPFASLPLFSCSFPQEVFRFYRQYFCPCWAFPVHVFRPPHREGVVITGWWNKQQEQAHICNNTSEIAARAPTKACARETFFPVFCKQPSLKISFGETKWLMIRWNRRLAECRDWCRLSQKPPRRVSVPQTPSGGSFSAARCTGDLRGFRLDPVSPGSARAVQGRSPRGLVSFLRWTL